MTYRKPWCNPVGHNKQWLIGSCATGACVRCVTHEDIRRMKLEEGQLPCTRHIQSGRIALAMPSATLSSRGFPSDYLASGVGVEDRDIGSLRGGKIL